jgi:preprotein translocase subunit SecE
MSTDADSLMDDKTPIKYLLIGDSSTNKLITEFSSGTSQSKTKKEINQIFNKLCKSSNKKLDERNKITSKDENYYFTFCKPDLIYVVLANNQYPERYVFELVQKINEEKIPSMVNDETRELNPSGRQQLKQLIDYYQDTKNINKIAEIQSDVDEIKVDMKENISKMVQSVDDTNKLQEKTDALKFETEDYKKNSVEVRKITWWQNFKLWIILGIVVLILIIIIILIVT